MKYSASPLVSTSTVLSLGALALVLSVTIVPAGNPDPNECDVPGEVPDVIVGDLHQTIRHGTQGGITAYSVGTVSCNQGTCWLNWFSGTNEHPVIGQNMYRLAEGRFEQIGQSWLKHGFFAFSQELCSPDCLGTSGSHLGVNCSDPYSASLNGNQSGLGPKFEVNPHTGVHPEPFTDEGATGGALYKRLQVANVDLDPDLNPGARYFVEGQYVTRDDAAAGKQDNNASYREVLVSGTDPVFNISLSGPTVREDPAIRVWQTLDPQVEQKNVRVPDDGVLIMGSKATDLGNGTWHYEYALHNLNSHRAVRSFSISIPLGASVSNIGFHDVDYHSGEPFQSSDWTHNGGTGGQLVWETETFDQNADANALRWGTLYNFRFDSDAPPAKSDVTLGLFRPGSPAEIVVGSTGPSLCNANGFCDPGETCAACAEDCANGTCDGAENSCNCSVDCGPPALDETVCGDLIDDDCDGFTDCDDTDCCDDEPCTFADGDGDTFMGCADCDDTNGDAWTTPGEVQALVLSQNVLDVTLLEWSPPAAPGGLFIAYDALRSDLAWDFTTDATCLFATDPTDTRVTDPEVPSSGELFFYLVRAWNDCPDAEGPLGAGSNGEPRPGVSCNPGP